MLHEEVRALPMAGEGARPVAAADLALGLSYLRASNLQVMRLQLAAERQDRRGVMAAIDELVGLDRELGRFIETIPGASTPAAGSVQQYALMTERLILSRGKSGPAFNVPPGPQTAPARRPHSVDDECAPYPEVEPARPLSSLLIFAGLCCVAIIALFYGLTGSLTSWLEWIR